MSKHQHLYNAGAWHRLRHRQIKDEPRCCNCAKMGRVTVATVADHIVRHNGDHDLFHDPDNLQSLCTNCHNSYKRRLEVSGTIAGCDVNGIPLDPKHNWRTRI